MSEKTGHGGTPFWSMLRGFWRGNYGLPLDEHVRADAGLETLNTGFTYRPISPFVGAWLR